MAARKLTGAPGRPATQAGRLVNPEPPLHEEEEVRWHRPAALCHGRSTLGGTLYITTQRLLFVANRFAGPRRPAPVELGLQELSAVGVEPRRGRPLLGGMPPRLRLERGEGQPLLFVVKHLDAVVVEVQAITQVGPSG
jgi:hypothetical protein